MNYRILLRILADALVLALLAWAPWWATLIAAIASAWLFAPYYELMLWGIAYDSLYGAHGVLYTFLSFLVFAGLEVFRPRSRISL